MRKATGIDASDVKLASTIGLVDLTLGQTSGGHTGCNVTDLYMAESESEKKADSLVGTGWEAKFFGRYNIGKILLEGLSQIYMCDIKGTHVSCLRSPFR